MDQNNKLNNIVNPATGKTFQEENRVISSIIENEYLVVTYNREGISPEQKRVIEDNIIEMLKGSYDENLIKVKTISSSSEDVMKNESSKSSCSSKEQPANLKVGHSTLPPKRKLETVKKVIAVSSCKGGVGKSTVAVNLAVALKNTGAKVGIVDADIYGPSLPMLLGQRDAKPKGTDDKKILPIEAHGLKFISFGLFVNEGDPVIWRGPMLGGVLNQFLFDVQWGELDYLIIDLPPGTGDMQLSVVQSLSFDGALVVSTPQDVALLDTKKGIKMFEQVDVRILGIVENMSYFVPDDAPDKKYYIFGNGGAKKAAEEMNIDFLGDIPMEIALREASDCGIPYMSENKNEGKAVWNAYNEIGMNIKNKLEGKKQSFLGKLFKR